MIKALFLTLVFFALLSCKSAGNRTDSDTSSVITKNFAWPNPQAVPLCFMNAREVSRELLEDTKLTIIAEFYNKTNIRFRRFDDCKDIDDNTEIIRFSFRRIYDWTGNTVKAGDGRSRIGRASENCGPTCGSATLRLDVSTNGEYPPKSSRYRQFIIDTTRATVVHEIGHALGLAHEHERTDAPKCRDTDVKILDGAGYIYSGRYDPYSIMNYCKTPEITSLSAGDIEGLNQLYPQKAPNKAQSGSVTLVARSSQRCLRMMPDHIVQQQDCDMSLEESFALVDHGNEVYSLKSFQDDLCVDIIESRKQAGTGAILFPCRGTANQKFKLTPSNPGYFKAKLEHSGKCLDIAGGGQDAGGKLIQWDCSKGTNQDFMVIRN